MKPFRTIVFDFDLTLVDSTRPVTRCINQALEQMGRDVVSEVDVRNTIGLTLVDTYRRLTGDDDREATDQFRELFHAGADRFIVAETMFLPGVEDAIRTMKDRELTLGIVSTKRRARILAILERLGLVESFDEVLGGDSVSRHKPHPEGLEAMLELLGSTANQCLFVGDHEVDGGAAMAASVPYVGVLTGGATAETLRPYSPLAVLDGVHRLPEWLAAAV